MTLSCDADEVHRITVVRPVEHVERLAEAEIAKDIHCQPVQPVGHVLRRAPTLGLGDLTSIVADGLAERADVGEDVTLNFFDGAIRESMREDSSLPSMELLVSGVVRIWGRVHERVVKLGFPDVGSEPVDFFERCIGVEGQRVRAKANHRPIDLMQPPELKMPVSLPCVVEHVGISELGQYGAWVLGQRMEP